MEDSRKTRVWLITGCSSGFGRSLAEEVLAHGDRVALTARNPQMLHDLTAKYREQAIALALDVTSPESIRAAVAATMVKFGRIDVAVNNAGYGLFGALEELGEEQLRRNIETNFVGPLHVMRAVLPVMRSQRSGHIVNMSAIAAFSNEMGFAVYGGAKAALEAASEAVYGESKPLGIKMTIVVPGPFRTDFISKGLDRGRTRIEDYDKTSGKFGSFLEKIDGKQPGDPVKAAQAIIQAVEADKPPYRLVLGKYAVDKVKKKLKTIEAEVVAWESIGAATDY